MTDPDSLLTLPPPDLPAETLSQLLYRHWGLTGPLSRLTSERDLNHRVDTQQGRYVLRLTNPAEPEAMTEFQTAAHLHVAARDPGLPVQRLVPLADGRPLLALPQGRLRLFTWLAGLPLAQAPRSPAQTRALGRGLARLTAALADFTHPAADHRLLWDIRQLPDLAGMAAGIADPGLRQETTAFIAGYSDTIAPQVNALPRQVVHADFNPHNLLVDPAAPETLTGILDFGDMVRTPRVCDLAVAASYHLGGEAPLDHLAALIAGYAETQPLTGQETALLYDLIQARMITTLTISAWRAARYPDNAAYILRNAPAARAGLAAFRALGRAPVTATIARAAGQETA
ncbi:MAG: phosphotransferase [Paracoccaceae bacterium]